MPIWEILADRGSDRALLSEAIASDLSAVAPLSLEIERKFARRLMDLGFPRQALMWAKREHPATIALNDEVFSAMAAFSQNNIMETQSDLSAITNSDARELRAPILTTITDDDTIPKTIKAEQLYEAPPPDGQGHQVPNLVGSGYSDFWREAVELTRSQKTARNYTPEKEDGEMMRMNESESLSDTRLLLQESTNARSTLDALLSQAPLDF